jgi:lipopolysaccharide transport system permease protein
MSDIAIRVESLSKQYRIGARLDPHATLRDQLADVFSLNPMAGVIDGFRWALLGTATLDWRVLAISCLIVAVILFSGLAYFNRTEETFADVI